MADRERGIPGAGEGGGEVPRTTEPSEAQEERAEERYEAELESEGKAPRTPKAPSSTATAWPLAREHELLGARTGIHPDGTPYVEGYTLGAEAADGAKEWGAAASGCALADLSDLTTLLIGGAGAASFVATVFSAPLPQPGEARYALALSGDGSVVAPVLLAAVAEEDFLVWVPAGLAEGLRAWLDAMGSLAGEDGPLWPRVAVEDPAQDLVCLALMGPETAEVLGDYLSEGERLPEPGTLRRLLLDRIVTTCVGLPAPADAWLVFMPAVLAPTIWRSLLSFPTVTPVGTPVLWGRLIEGREGLSAYLEAPIRPYTPRELGLEGLLRKDGGFIGARALGLGPTRS